MSSKDILCKSLTAAKQQFELLDFGYCQILFLYSGGRILGLYPNKLDDNFFWVNPLLFEIETSKRLFAGAEWVNTGGDRTWIAPEKDYFFPEYPDFECHCVPFQIDPGDFKSIHISNGIKVINEGVINSYKTNTKVKIKYTKEIRFAADPLRHEKELSVFPIWYAGYSLSSSLEIIEGNAENFVGLWNILQLPQNGQVLLPTYSKVTPTIYFGEIKPNQLQIGKYFLSYKTISKDAQKIGIPAVYTTGRAGYIYEISQNTYNLIIRNSYINPSGEYVDVPLKSVGLNKPVYAIQAFSIDDATIGTFAELEYHSPAIKKSNEQNVINDLSQVWAYRGNFKTINSIVKLLLGIDLLNNLS